MTYSFSGWFNNKRVGVNLETENVELIAKMVLEALESKKETAGKGYLVPIGVSARHVHLTQEHVEALFGKGHELTFDRPLSQPGQFLSKEKVTIKNGDRKIERVSILGPVRKASQVEVSKTDSVALRAEGFIRESGDLAGTAPVELEGPEGSIQLSEGLIIAKRHIHMTPENAAEAGLKDKDVVSVAVNTDGRKTIFGDVVVRVEALARGFQAFPDLL